MAAASKPHGTNSSHSTESDTDETITMIVVALAKGLGLLVWWSVLFPMISVPTIASVWAGSDADRCSVSYSRRCPGWPYWPGPS